MVPCRQLAVRSIPQPHLLLLTTHCSLLLLYLLLTTSYLPSAAFLSHTRSWLRSLALASVEARPLTCTHIRLQAGRMRLQPPGHLAVVHEALLTMAYLLWHLAVVHEAVVVLHL